MPLVACTIFSCLWLKTIPSQRLQMLSMQDANKQPEKETLTVYSSHNGSLLRQQPRAARDQFLSAGLFIPDDQRVTLRNPDGVLVHQIIELGGYSSEVEVCQAAAHAVLPDLLQGWGYWGHICAWRQEALHPAMLMLRDHTNLHQIYSKDGGGGGGGGKGLAPRSPAPTHVDPKRTHPLLYQTYNKIGEQGGGGGGWGIWQAEGARQARR